MADEIQGISAPNEGQPQADDRFKNLQAEMSRKYSNVEDKLAAINQQLTQLSLLGNNVQKPEPRQEEIPDAVLDPKGYANYIKNQVAQETRAMIEVQQRQQAELGSLVSMYPELQQQDSDLTREALKVYNSMSAADKANPLAYKSAIQSAALELGILPKHKRQQAASKPNQDDSDDIGNSNTNSPQGRQQNVRKKTKVDQATLAFAAALGKDVNDPEYIKRLEKAASRETWGKYKSSKD